MVAVRCGGDNFPNCKIILPIAIGFHQDNENYLFGNKLTLAFGCEYPRVNTTEINSFLRFVKGKRVDCPPA